MLPFRYPGLHVALASILLAADADYVAAESTSTADNAVTTWSGRSTAPTPNTAQTASLQSAYSSGVSSSLSVTADESGEGSVLTNASTSSSPTTTNRSSPVWTTTVPQTTSPGASPTPTAVFMLSTTEVSSPASTVQTIQPTSSTVSIDIPSSAIPSRQQYVTSPVAPTELFTNMYGTTPVLTTRDSILTPTPMSGSAIQPTSVTLATSPQQGSTLPTPSIEWAPSTATADAPTSSSISVSAIRPTSGSAAATNQQRSYLTTATSGPSTSRKNVAVTATRPEQTPRVTSATGPSSSAYASSHLHQSTLPTASPAPYTAAPTRGVTVKQSAPMPMSPTAVQPSPRVSVSPSTMEQATSDRSIAYITSNAPTTMGNATRDDVMTNDTVFNVTTPVGVWVTTSPSSKSRKMSIPAGAIVGIVMALLIIVIVCIVVMEKRHANRDVPRVVCVRRQTSLARRLSSTFLWTNHGALNQDSSCDMQYTERKNSMQRFRVPSRAPPRKSTSVPSCVATSVADKRNPDGHGRSASSLGTDMEMRTMGEQPSILSMINPCFDDPMMPSCSIPWNDPAPLNSIISAQISTSVVTQVTSLSPSSSDINKVNGISEGQDHNNRRDITSPEASSTGVEQPAEASNT